MLLALKVVKPISKICLTLTLSKSFVINGNQRRFAFNKEHNFRSTIDKLELP